MMPQPFDSIKMLMVTISQNLLISAVNRDSKPFNCISCADLCLLLQALLTFNCCCCYCKWTYSIAAASAVFCGKQNIACHYLQSFVDFVPLPLALLPTYFKNFKQSERRAHCTALLFLHNCFCSQLKPNQVVSISAFSRPTARRHGTFPLK